MADRAECFSAGTQPFASPQAFIEASLENNVPGGDSTLTSREPLACRSLHWEDEESTQARLFKLSSTILPPNALKEFIKNRDVDFNAPHESSGVTCLMCACVSGHHDNAKLLLKKGASPVATDRDGFNPLHCAIWGKNLKCVKPLLSKNQTLSTSLDRWSRNTVHLAALVGDLVVYKFFSKKYRMLLESRDEHQRTVLHWAVLSKQVVLVKFVLGQTKAPLRGQQDRDGASALHYAMIAGSTEITQLLLTKGCDPLAVDNRGFTPLHWASVLGDSQLVECLLQCAGASGDGGMVNVCSTRGLSALHCAASVGSVAVCEHLMSANAMINSEDSEGMTALHRASRFGHTKCVRSLLSHDATITTLSHTKQSCLHLASEHGHSEVAEELISHGADRDQPVAEPPGNCPIHLAALAGHTHVLDALLGKGCSTELSRVGDHRTALHLSAAKGHLSCCKLLIEKGAHLSSSDSTVEQYFCYKLLLTAVTSEPLVRAHYSLKHPFTPSTLSPKSLTLKSPSSTPQCRLSPLDLALLGHHQTCIECLIASGARTTGGRYHRAAATIQLSRKFFVHKRRVRIARQCASLVLQHTVRAWMRRRKAQRLRRVRERRQHQAAQIIQNVWTGYSLRKKAFEESCAALRLKIDKERTATRIILSELQQQTTQTHLPSTAPQPPPSQSAVVPAPPNLSLSSSLPPLSQHFSPSKLLRSTLHTSSTFPASSLTFRERPRKPLSNSTHRVKLDSKATSTSTLISVVGTPAGEQTDNPAQDTAAQNDVRISSSKERKITFLPPLELRKPLVAKSTTNSVAIPTTSNIKEATKSPTALVALPNIPNTKEASIKTPTTVVVLPAISTATSTKEATKSPTTAVAALPTSSTATSASEATKSAVPNKLPRLIEEYESDDLNSFIVTARSRIEAERNEAKSKPQNRHKYLKRASKKFAIDEDLLLNQADRFTKLKELSSLLQEARETQHDERAGSYGATELKQQIKATLAEAVRLRAETETIHRKSKVRAK